MTDPDPVVHAAPRLSWRGGAAAAAVWAVYTVLYAAAVTALADVPFRYALVSQTTSHTILALLSVPVWVGVVQRLDGRPGRQLAAHAAVLPLYAVGGTALFLGVYVLADVAEAADGIRERFGWIAVGTAMVYVAQFAVYHVVAVSQRATRERQAAERLRAAAREQELAALRAQLNPHFLFNALNAISAEVVRDPAEARERIGQLAGLLRYSLDSGRRDVVPLVQELAFVRDYLALESARMGDRLRATVEADDGALDALVPPMALQTLVENAVRHGVAPAPGGGSVAVTARTERDAVAVCVADTGVGAEPEALWAGGGVGVANTDERLRLLVGEGLSFEADRARGVAVSFRLPLDVPASARAVPAGAPPTVTS